MIHESRQIGSSTLSRVRRVLAGSAVALGMWLLLVTAGSGQFATDQAKPGDTKPAVAAIDESFLQTPAGFERAGRPAVVDDKTESGRVSLTILDDATGMPTMARVNVVGADGHYYEPAEHPLAPFSLHRLGNRAGKGPLRYFGWFFYCPGTAVVKVPAGAVRVEVWKGYEFRPQQVTTRVSSGGTREITVRLTRTVSMTDQQYHSGDAHIHLPRRTADDDERALDLLACEDIEIGYLLCHNASKEYAGDMRLQLAPQERGFGPQSVARRGAAAIASGQEYVTSNYGHMLFLMHQRLVQEGQTVDPNRWPTFTVLGEEVRRLGGTSIHAHGGYAQEIFIDLVRGKTDCVELLQFAEYRGIELSGWYRFLNAGFRVPALGASDYPFCRALGDCRTYVRSATRPDPASWVRLAREGRSFMTTGPLLLLEVAGETPGGALHKSGAGPHRVAARVRARCEVAAIERLELIVNGVSERTLTIPPDAGLSQWIELDEELSLTESSWIAARASSAGTRPDVAAHTNPVFVIVDGRAPYRPDDLDWLLARVDEQIAKVEQRTFDEKSRVLDEYRRARDELKKKSRANQTERE